MNKKLLLFLLVLLICNFSQAQFTFNTVPPLNGGNGSGGTTFQVTANSAIIINGFNASIQSSTQTVEVWYSATDLTGPPNVTTANGWIQLGTATITGTSVGLTPTIQQIPLATNLFMTAGTTYRFYIGCSTCSVIYTTFNASNGNPYSDSFITINTGSNIGYGGSLPNPTFHPRQFNGGIIYLPGVGLDLALTSIVDPITLSVGNNNLTINVANYAADTIYQADLHYSFNNGTTVTVNDYVFPSPITSGKNFDYTFPTPFNVPSDGSYDISTWVSDVNGLAAADSNISNDSITISLCTGLSGNYTIDSTQATSGSNYMSFQEALADMNSCGVSGSVIFDVAADTYNLQLSIPQVLGADSSKTVTFRSDSSNSNPVVLTYDSNTISTNYILKLDGADWLTFEDLTFAPTNSNYSRAIELTNAANHNTIDNCIFNGDTATNTTSNNKALIYSENSTNNYNTITNSTFNDGSYSIFWRGNSASPNIETEISNNTFENWYYQGVHLYYNLDLHVTNNIIRSATAYTGTIYGLQNYYSDEAQVITGNKMGPITTTGSTYAFDLNSCDGTSNKKGLIANNMLFAGDTGSTSANYGISINNSGFQNVVHNSIVVAGYSTGNRAVYINGGGALEVVNNNITNFGAGTGIYLNTSYVVIVGDHNNIYAPNGDVGYISSAQTSLHDWQTASGLDQNSVSVNSIFTDWYSADLHLCNDTLNNGGQNLQGLVNVDFDGTTRNSITPDIGAVEFTSITEYAFSTDTVMLCVGDSVTLTGATNGETNLWSTTETTSSIQVTTPGSYSVQMTGTCASYSDTIQVVYSALAVSAQLDNNISCNGIVDGEVSSIVTGGSSPYSYSWSNAGLTNKITGLAAGNYTVTVEDQNGCSVIDSIVVSEPLPLISSIAVDTLISCNGIANGAMSATGTGGTSPFAYSWSNSQTNSSITGLPSGSYSVTITDANGCSAVSASAISEPALLIANINMDSNVTCFGGANGGATALGIGGTAPHTYLWSNSATTSTIAGIVAGTYTVSISDNNGCISSNLVTISEPAVATIVTSVTTDISCNGLSNGVGNATTSGGISPYTYSWSNGDQTSSISNLSAGTYSVTSSDANGCMVVGSINLTDPVVLGSVVNSTNVTCLNGNDGAASAIITGGTAPYSYIWNTPSLGVPQVTGLSADTYHVTVTDANGCQLNDSAVIADGQALPLINLGVDTNICMEDSIILSGGSGFTSYTWSTGENSASITSNIGGSYWVEVTNSNGCKNRDTIMVNYLTSMNLTASKQNVVCQFDSSGSIMVNVTGGTTPYNYIWNDPAGQTSSNAINLVNGTYMVTVTDANGCVKTSSTSVGFDFSKPVVDIGPAIDTICETYDYYMTPGEGFSNYLWSTGDTASVIKVSTPGTYSVLATDINGCENSDSISLIPGICVGIEDVNQAIGMRFFPNPTNGRFELSIDGLEGQNGELSIVSLQGKMVWNEQLENIPNTFNKHLDLSNQAKGVYIVTLTTNKQSLTQRIILQ